MTLTQRLRDEASALVKDLRQMADGIELLPVSYDDEADKLRAAATLIETLTARLEDPNWCKSR